jgi:hypothetical protein
MIYWSLAFFCHGMALSVLTLRAMYDLPGGLIVLGLGLSCLGLLFSTWASKS